MSTQRGARTTRRHIGDGPAVTTTETPEVGEQPAPPLLLSVAEGARLLGISRTKAYELVMSGQLQSVKLGRLRKIRPGDLEAFVAGLDGS